VFLVSFWCSLGYWGFLSLFLLCVIGCTPFYWVFDIYNFTYKKKYLTTHVIHNWILTIGCFQAREDAELPEYILGTVRLNRVRLDSAVHFEI
jgi:hypothetical protein